MNIFEDLGLFDFACVDMGKNFLVNSAEMNYKILLAVSLYQKGESVFFVCTDDLQAKNVSVKLQKYVGKDAMFYPAEGLYFSYVDSYSQDNASDRLNVIYRLLRREKVIVVLSIAALCEKRAFFTEDDIMSYSAGDTLEPEELAKKLTLCGYTRDDRTEGVGQFTLRGGIVDIFSPNMDEPVRIELWGDEIDSIRTFDPINQLSTGNVDSIEILPCTDCVLTEDDLKEALGKYKADIDSHTGTVAENVKSQATESFGYLYDRLTRSYSNINRLLYMYSANPLMSIAHLCEEGCVLLSEPGLRDSCREWKRSVDMDFAIQFEDHSVLKRQAEIFFDFEEVIHTLGEHTVFVLSGSDDGYPYIEPQITHRANCINVLSYKGNMTALMKQIPMYLSDEYKVILTYTSDDEQTTLRSLLENFGLTPSEVKPGNVSIIRSEIYHGIDSIATKTIIIPACEILGGELPKPKKKKIAVSETFFSDVAPGDYIVHEKHGIGRYEGIERIETAGVSRDYFRITYAKDDVLYVPAENMDRVQKYVGSNDNPPKLNRLGGNEWTNTKSKVSKAVKELAKEYVVMYANRQRIKGYAFSEDSDWQSGFEAKFPYEPTADQIKATDEIKADMQKAAPMDRLLCGDVGFGKTEVAIRAAFKAVLDSKQVAVLAPTTILALQHYNNFVERFKDYPVKIEMMSRFRSAKEIKQTVKNLASGMTEIVIGTHRILSKDVEFKDLGLLIIDEEQRFGVAHKDKLKVIKQDIDTLSLSATPIPRTLHMSLSGIRDISTIEEAPADRLPVQTYVMQYDASVVKQAISNEIARGGQVFYLHNRVGDIDRCAADISSLVPGAKVVFAHGQMDEKEIESTVMSFLNREFDVLVSTTIIENGIDIVNANTMIIEDADRLGLSQLYQLRGRVGRGKRQAYCYMLYARDKQLSEIASKRLSAMKEFTKFGSGFKIAMRDLQIRGAGNLLGANQHGHFANVGYEMYCRMLAEAVADEMGVVADTVRPIETEIDITVDAYIPGDYITGEADRIEAYKLIASIKDEEDFDDVAYNLTDRYSDMPVPVENLLKTALLKALASGVGVTKIRQNDDMYMFEYENADKFDPTVVQYLADKKYIVKLRRNSKYPIFAVVKPKEKNNLRFCTEIIKNIISK